MEETKRTETKIKLNRGMTGNYGWEITLSKEDLETGELLRILKKVDANLRQEWLEGGIEEDED